MDENDDLFRSFSRLGNGIVAERDRLAAAGAREPDIAFDLLAMIVKHYHEEYCPRTSSKSCLDNLLGPYPWDAGASAVPIEDIREQILARCDQELDSVPEKVIAALRGEYLTFLWRTLRDRDVAPEPRDQEKDGEKLRSTLVGLGFSEPYRPRWGFSYICKELETARNSLSCIDDASVDAKTIEAIRDDTKEVGLEVGSVLVLAVFPMGPDDLCRVNQQVYVRVGTHCQTADDPWIHEWYRIKEKRWL